MAERQKDRENALANREMSRQGDKLAKSRTDREMENRHIDRQRQQKEGA